jgi:hypothetical protein
MTPNGRGESMVERCVYELPRLRSPPGLEPPIRHGRIWLIEAVDRLGKYVYGAQWTGLELIARALPWPPKFTGPQRSLSWVLEIVPPDYKPSREEALPPDWWWFVSPKGMQSFPSKEEAKRAWAEGNKEFAAFVFAERNARKRFDHVVTLLLGVLTLPNGLCAYVWERTRTGKEFPLPIDYWGRNIARAIFEMADDPVRWKNPNFGTFPVHHEGKTHRFEGGVVILSDELDAILSKIKAPSPLADLKIRGLEKADEPLIAEMVQIVRTHKISPTAAAKRVVARAIGGGTEESKIKRLVHRYASQRCGQSSAKLSKTP